MSSVFQWSLTRVKLAIDVVNLVVFRTRLFRIEFDVKFRTYSVLKSRPQA